VIVTLLVEDLLLLLVDDATGRPVLDRTRLERALAGAVLVELALRERVAAAPPGGAVKAGRIVVLHRGPTGDAILDEALTRLVGTPLRPARAVEKLVKGLRRSVLTRLVETGFVGEEHRRVFGVFPATAWPAIRPEHATRLRDALRAVLVAGAEPDVRTSALVALLVAVDATPKVLPVADKRALVQRAGAVADGDWAGRAVREAVDAVMAAVIA
jgi:hypothetical protein